MNKYDVEIKYQMNGSNQFGKGETLNASTFRSVEADSEDQAIEIARALEPTITPTKFSVCKR